MNKICKRCKAQFPVTEKDKNFYKKVGVPAPTLCPQCRMRRRFTFRNERHLYHRKCDLSGKQIVSMYSPDKSVKVYDQKEWWSDKYDPLQYGRDFDFNRSFFEQFAELFREVPRINLNSKEHENSEFCNFSVFNKNCYLCFTAAYNHDCCYSNRMLNCTDCFDSSNVTECEFCYEVVDSTKCYGSAYLQNCTNCSDCFLGYDLKGCRNCFACFSLANKEYCIGNKQYKREEYEKIVAEYMNNFQAVKEGYIQHLKKAVRKYVNGVSNENASGDNISNCKDSQECFEAKELQDCSYIAGASKLKDCYDVNSDDNSELDYETIGAESNYHQCFCDICWYNKNIFYCSLCFNSEDLFGCVGMKKGKYCILNKQYTKEEYEKLVPKIIEKMTADGEWGEFFPSEISPFAYNETMAFESWPMTQKEALEAGLSWHNDESEKMYKGEIYEVPEKISEVKDDICSHILRCEITGQPYKVNPKELQFHRRLGVPISRRCQDQRHRDRLVLRNPKVLYDRKCDKCSVDIRTTYAPDRTEQVYCEECYQKEIY